MKPLSLRQREVCVMVALGLATKEIAIRLGLSPRTIEQHLKRVFVKYEVKGVHHLALKLYAEAAE